VAEPPYDALLVVSFGGPQGPDDVWPFLENVTRGRDVPRERLAIVAAQYERFGGVSPINGHTRRLVAAVQDELSAEGPKLTVYWGNRNWHPFLADTLARMADDGARRALAFVTSAFSSYPSCRQYLEDIASARRAVGARAPDVDKLRVFFNHPGFIEAVTARVDDALAQLPPEDRGRAPLVFTAHSIPLAMAAASDYEVQLHEAAGLVASGIAGSHSWAVVFQSRSGPPSQPWLEPDVGDHLEQLAARGERAAVVVPLGFVSDHMEVVYDLDVQARERAVSAGLTMVRAATVGDDPKFVAMIRELVLERTEGAPRRARGTLGPRDDTCSEGCCSAHPGQ
jgi:ferrochelatase